MRISLSLFGQWPYLKNADTNLEIFSSSDCVPDIYITSTLKSQSIKDIMFSGSLFHIFRDMKYKIILITDCDLTCDEYNVIKSFEDYVDEFVMIGDLQTLKMKLTTIKDEDVLVCNILCKLVSPLELKNEVSSSNHKVVNSVLLQKIANVAANEIVNDICTSFSDSYSMCISYNSCEIIDEDWVFSNKAFALLPNGVITEMVSTNTNSLIVYTLDKLNIDLSNTDLSDNHDNNCAITFDEKDKELNIISHILYNDRKFLLYDEITETTEFKDSWPQNFVITSSNSSNLLLTEWKNSDECKQIYNIFFRNYNRFLLRRSDPMSFLINDTHNITSLLLSKNSEIVSQYVIQKVVSKDDAQSQEFEKSVPVCEKFIAVEDSDVIENDSEHTVQNSSTDVQSSSTDVQSSSVDVVQSQSTNAAEDTSLDAVEDTSISVNIEPSSIPADNENSSASHVVEQPVPKQSITEKESYIASDKVTEDISAKERQEVNDTVRNDYKDNVTSENSETNEKVQVSRIAKNSVGHMIPQSSVYNKISYNQHSVVPSSASSSSVFSHPSSPSPSIIQKQIWGETVKGLISKQFGSKYIEKVDTVLHDLKETIPYTLIISESYVYVLMGIFPSQVIISMISSSLTLNLPTHDNNIVRVINENNVPRIGKIRIDLEESIYFQNIMIYKEKEKMKPKENIKDVKLTNSITSATSNKSYSKGSVSKMNKRIELSRILTHR